MSQAWISVVFVVVLLALVPVALKWVQRRTGLGVASAAVASKIVSVVGVGPHQRVVTVEVGPEDARVWLTLGVTQQQITCLHTFVLPRDTTLQSGQSLYPLPEERPESSNT